MSLWRLFRGGNAPLTKDNPGLTRIRVGLSWDPPIADSTPFDLDACAFFIGANGKVRSDEDMVYYNHLISADGALVHQGDNRTGDGEGDDEVILVELGKIPSDVAKIVISVSIHEAGSRKLNFGMVRNAAIRIINDVTSQELGRFELTDQAADETSMIFGEIYRHEREWKFRAVGQGFQLDLGALAKFMGVDVEPTPRVGARAGSGSGADAEPEPEIEI